MNDLSVCRAANRLISLAAGVSDRMPPSTVVTLARKLIPGCVRKSKRGLPTKKLYPSCLIYACGKEVKMGRGESFVCVVVLRCVVCVCVCVCVFFGDRASVSWLAKVCTVSQTHIHTHIRT